MYNQSLKNLAKLFLLNATIGSPALGSFFFRVKPSEMCYLDF